MLKKLIILLIFIITLYADGPDMPEFTTQEKMWLEGKPELTFSEVNWKPLSFVSKNMTIKRLMSFRPSRVRTD